MPRVAKLENYQDVKIDHLTCKEKTTKITKRGIVNAWKCLCDCGKWVVRPERDFQNGHYKSCGCKRSIKMTGHTGKRFRGIGEIPATYIWSVKRHAKDRGILYEIEDDNYLWELFLLQDRKCALTGLPLDMCSQRQARKGVPNTASLDRIDSNKNYTKENIQWIHKDVNLMKNHFDEKRFEEIARLFIAKKDSLKNRTRYPENQSLGSF